MTWVYQRPKTWKWHPKKLTSKKVNSLTPLMSVKWSLWCAATKRITTQLKKVWTVVTFRLILNECELVVPHQMQYNKILEFRGIYLVQPKTLVVRKRQLLSKEQLKKETLNTFIRLKRLIAQQSRLYSLCQRLLQLVLITCCFRILLTSKMRASSQIFKLEKNTS